MEISQFKHPYVFFDNAIGDSFIALPALRALSTLTNGNLSIITCGERCGHINNTIFHELEVRQINGIDVFERDGEKDIHPDEAISLFWDCDLLIYMNTWMPTKAAIQQIFDWFNPRPSLGFYKYMSNRIAFRKDIHTADLLFQFPKYFNEDLKLEHYGYSPEAPPEFMRLARSIKQKLPDKTKLLVVHADTKPEKTWPLANYEPLLDRILASFPELIVIIVGVTKPEIENCTYRSRILRFEQTLPFTINWAFVTVADIFIGVDSVFLHIADLSNIPSVSLFGPSSSLEWGTRFSALSRCRQAPSGDISDITIEEVYTSFCEVMECLPLAQPTSSKEKCLG